MQVSCLLSNFQMQRIWQQTYNEGISYFLYVYIRLVHYQMYHKFYRNSNFVSPTNATRHFLHLFVNPVRKTATNDDNLQKWEIKIPSVVEIASLEPNNWNSGVAMSSVVLNAIRSTGKAMKKKAGRTDEWFPSSRGFRVFVVDVERVDRRGKGKSSTN